MIQHRNFGLGRFVLKSFEIFSELETVCLFKHRTVSSEKQVTISINDTDFKVMIEIEEDKTDTYRKLEKKFFNGEEITGKYRYPDDVVDGPGFSISVKIQYKEGWVYIERI